MKLQVAGCPLAAPLPKLDGQRGVVLARPENRSSAAGHLSQAVNIGHMNAGLTLVTVVPTSCSVPNEVVRRVSALRITFVLECVHLFFAKCPPVSVTPQATAVVGKTNNGNSTIVTTAAGRVACTTRALPNAQQSGANYDTVNQALIEPVIEPRETPLNTVAC